MATITKWIGSNGEILLPLPVVSTNDSPLISTKGTYFIPIFEAEAITIVEGNPMGLLLTLTYPATP